MLKSPTSHGYMNPYPHSHTTFMVESNLFPEKFPSFHIFASFHMVNSTSVANTSSFLIIKNQMFHHFSSQNPLRSLSHIVNSQFFTEIWRTPRCFINFPQFPRISPWEFPAFRPVSLRAAVGLHQLRRGVGRLAAEDHQIQQGVGAQAVGTVHWGAARLDFPMGGGCPDGKLGEFVSENMAKIEIELTDWKSYEFNHNYGCWPEMFAVKNWVKHPWIMLDHGLSRDV